ncbi:MAG: SWIM zinc finger family protein [Ilumatobacteraceae bacterium]
MSRPVRALGRNQPGQFMATRVRVLAAELSDPQRLARGREYVDTCAVVDIEVGPGLTTATVQGSRPAPYVVELNVDHGDGPPSRLEVDASCSCPDDAEAADGWCKHAVATLIVLANEIAVEPGMLARWRSPGPEVPTGVESGRPTRPSAGAGPDPLASALRGPDGISMPVIPDIEPLPAGTITDPDVAAVLRSAYQLICGDPPPPSEPPGNCERVPGV